MSSPELGDPAYPKAPKARGPRQQQSVYSRGIAVKAGERSRVSKLMNWRRSAVAMPDNFTVESVSQVDAEATIDACGLDGAFFYRKSTAESGSIVLTMGWGNRPHHFLMSFPEQPTDLAELHRYLKKFTRKHSKSNNSLLPGMLKVYVTDMVVAEEGATATAAPEEVLDVGYEDIIDDDADETPPMSPSPGSGSPSSQRRSLPATSLRSPPLPGARRATLPPLPPLPDIPDMEPPSPIPGLSGVVEVTYAGVDEVVLMAPGPGGVQDPVYDEWQGVGGKNVQPAQAVGDGLYAVVNKAPRAKSASAADDDAYADPQDALRDMALLDLDDQTYSTVQDAKSPRSPAAAAPPPLLPKGSPNKLIEAVAAERAKTSDDGNAESSNAESYTPPPRSVSINMAGGYEEVGDDEEYVDDPGAEGATATDGAGADTAGAGTGTGAPPGLAPGTLSGMAGLATTPAWIHTTAPPGSPDSPAGSETTTAVPPVPVGSDDSADLDIDPSSFNKRRTVGGSVMFRPLVISKAKPVPEAASAAAGQAAVAVAGSSAPSLAPAVSPGASPGNTLRRKKSGGIKKTGSDHSGSTKAQATAPPGLTGIEASSASESEDAVEAQASSLRRKKGGGIKNYVRSKLASPSVEGGESES